MTRASRLQGKYRAILSLSLVAAAFLFIALLGHLAGTRQLKPLPPSLGKPDYGPLRQEVAGYLNTLPGTYGIYFKDLESGQTFGINENIPIPPASCIKVPVVLYLYRQVAEGRLQWNDRVRYDRASDYQVGAGALQYTARDGDTFSLRCLATVAITISDNVAHNMLVRYLGYGNVMNYIKSIAPSTTRPYGSGATTASDMGSVIEAVIKFARENPRQGGRLIDDLSHTIFHVGLPGELPPKLQVAHKEGSINGVANDMGIVFGRRPYILVVLSRGITDEDTGFRNIAEISRIVYNYQQRLPAAPDLGIPRS
ncbi:MAG TPA: serine hydrolase [Syntrophomonadaceae bacterium]|nr:serine hydrolase [Syntrophomonadaceae bacterium]